MTSDRSSGSTPAGGSAGEPRYGTSGYESTDDETSDRPIHVHEETVEPRVHEETVVRERAIQRYEPDNDNQPVNVAVGAERRDGVRWGPIWAGLLTALSTFLLLELLFFGLGWLTLDPGESDPGSSAGLVTGILALVGFFLGGLVAGATAMWKGLFSGLLHGFMVWALGVVAFIALTFFGASSLLGSFGDLTSRLGIGPDEVQQTTDVSSGEATEVAETAKDAALPAFFGLALPLAASMLGGLIGSKVWPRRDDSDPETIQLRS